VHRAVQPAMEQLTGGGGAAGPEGLIRVAVAGRHQLLAVEGQGGPCATAFIHAGGQAEGLSVLGCCVMDPQSVPDRRARALPT
jgi:hypothetical protein